MKYRESIWAVAIAGATIVVAACASNPGTEPEDMSAADHRNAAEQEEREAKEHQGKYNTKARRTSGADVGGGDTFSFPMTSYNPTTHHLESADKHRRHAHAHREAAATLENWEEQECGDFPPETRKACPLIGHVESVEDIAGGVRIKFAASVNIDAAIAHVKCHRAFAGVQGFKGMDSCPMYVKKVTVKADPKARTVDFIVDDPDLVDDLRARAAAHVAP